MYNIIDSCMCPYENLPSLIWYNEWICVLDRNNIIFSLKLFCILKFSFYFEHHFIGKWYLCWSIYFSSKGKTKVGISRAIACLWTKMYLKIKYKASKIQIDDINYCYFVGNESGHCSANSLDIFWLWHALITECYVIPRVSRYSESDWINLKAACH